MIESVVNIYVADSLSNRCLFYQAALAKLNQLEMTTTDDVAQGLLLDDVIAYRTSLHILLLTFSN